MELTYYQLYDISALERDSRLPSGWGTSPRRDYRVQYNIVFEFIDSPLDHIQANWDSIGDTKLRFKAQRALKRMGVL